MKEKVKSPDFWQDWVPVKYPNLMSCSEIKFVDESYRESYRDDESQLGQKMLQEFEAIFKKYGVKSADLVYNLFNCDDLEPDDDIRMPKNSKNLEK